MAWVSMRVPVGMGGCEDASRCRWAWVGSGVQVGARAQAGKGHKQAQRYKLHTRSQVVPSGCEDKSGHREHGGNLQMVLCHFVTPGWVVEHSNLNCCNWMYLDFLHSDVVWMLKYLLADTQADSCLVTPLLMPGHTHLHPCTCLQHCIYSHPLVSLQLVSLKIILSDFKNSWQLLCFHSSPTSHCPLPMLLMPLLPEPPSEIFTT